MYHFISGYTAKVGGTEAGVREPQATFSACFGAPFMVLHPSRYADLLAARIREHQTRCWLVNTGWTGGPYGIGQRIAIEHTRAMLAAALEGELDDTAFRRDEVFGLDVPESVPDVPKGVLDPRGTWSDSKAYDEKARELVGRFRENFEQFTGKMPPEVGEAGV